MQPGYLDDKAAQLGRLNRFMVQFKVYSRRGLRGSLPALTHSLFPDEIIGYQ
jgi:hypothetical protein